MSNPRKKPRRTSPRTVWCPICNQRFVVSMTQRAYRAEIRRWHGYPQCWCQPCILADSQARLYGGVAEDYRNPEKPAV